MKPLDFLALTLICLVWAFSNVLSKIVVSSWSVPPLFFGAIRFAVVVAVTMPYLLPVPRPLWRILAIASLMGAGNFALLYIGLQTATPSAAGVVLQVGVPFTALLSVVLLRERIHRRRAIGIALTMAGVLLVAWDPDGVALSIGLLFVMAAAFAGSLGAVLMKQVDDVPPLRFQAWVALVSFLPLTATTTLLERGQWSSALAVGWPFFAAVLFSALIVSLLAHTNYYRLIGLYEASLLAPLTLMTPLFTIALGIVLTGDRLDARLLTGTFLAIAGVVMVTVWSRPAEGFLTGTQQP